MFRFKSSFMKTALIAISLLMLLAILIIAGYENFSQHRDTVVRQQQEHLLTMAKSLSRSFDAYINDKVDGLSVLAQNPMIAGPDGKYEEAVKVFYREFGDEMEKVMLLDETGGLIYKYPYSSDIKKIDEAALNYVQKSKKAFVTKEYESAPNEFSIDILQPVEKNNELSGILIGTISLNKLYKSLAHPIKPGKMGYAMVKNMNGVIIMHPVKEQIGTEALKDRKEKFPEYNWKELEELYRKQVEEGEGYHIYHSNWWQDNGMKWSKKINAYTTVRISDIAWIISVQMDYSEIEQPIRGTLVNISMIALIITAFLLIIAYIIFRIDKDRKALELETKYLKELNKTWEELIKSEARLRHSQKLQTIGTLTSGIAHEFNNLLTPILGYSEILLQRIDDKDSMHEDVEEIQKSASRAKEIIEQILVFGRNDHGAVRVKPLRIDCIARESIKMVKSILPNNIKITENIESSGSVLGNATQLQQVLINLYTNSYHAMKVDGGLLELNVVTVNISGDENAALNLKTGKYVKVQVKDTGTGMDEEVLSQIFDPFFTTKETGEGTGLGLSVVHGIVKNHNGCIMINSAVNAGTTVDIYLPAVEDVIYEDSKQEGLLKGEGSIIIIDDNISALKMLESGLNSSGYNVVTESDGLKAMELLDKNPLAFDVAIVDYTMPNISGLEVARHIRHINPEMRIILVSGYIKEDLAASNKSLFDDYMLKPIVIRELADKIKQIQQK